MPTESFVLAEVSPSYTGMLGNEKTTLSRSSQTVEFWRFAMEKGGWKPRQGVYASVTVQINAATLPVRTPEPAGGDGAKLPGSEVCAREPAIAVYFPGGTPVSVRGYDPGKYTEPPCPHFAYGFIQEDTYRSFVNALTEATGFMLFSETPLGDVREVKLISPEPGPFRNGIRVEGWVSGTAWYGGRGFQSGTYRGKFISVEGVEGPGTYGGRGHHGWQFTVRLHNGEADIFGGTPQTFSLALHPAKSAPAFRICVCPYQFAIWLEGRGDQPDGLPYPRSLLISMPWVPESFTGHDSFVFGVNSINGGFRQTLEWDGRSQFNGQWSADSATFRRMIVPVMRTRSTTVNDPDRLVTTQGTVVADNAYVTSRREPESRYVIHNRLAGKLWNCCAVSDNYPPSAVYSEMMDGTWVHIGSQSWHPDYSTLPYATAVGTQKASLWWKVTSGDLFPETA